MRLKRKFKDAIAVTTLVLGLAVTPTCPECDALFNNHFESCSQYECEEVVEEELVEIEEPAEEPIDQEEEVVEEPVEYSEDTIPCEYIGTFEATAYCSCTECCGKSDGITASGTTATEGRTIAVDPDIIPIGSHVFVEWDNGNAIGEFIAEDTGSAIQGYRIDIFFDSHYHATNFGRQTVKVYIID